MPDPRHARQILGWHLAAGVDETIGETAVDRFAADDAKTDPAKPKAAAEPVGAGPNEMADSQAPATVTPPARAASVPPAQAAPVPPAQASLIPPATANGGNEVSVHSAVEAAAAAGTVEQLRTALEAFEGCALKKTATNLVFTDGNPEARLMFVGEAPGAEEDRQGLPFVGPSGRLLDRMIASIGMARSDVLISNTVFWRPPGNRTPTPQETAVCMPFVERLIELVDPDVLVTLGGPAAKSVLAETQGVGRLRGRWFTYETARMSHPIDATPMFHPAYLLRSPGQKRDTWRDLLAVKKRLAE